MKRFPFVLLAVSVAVMTACPGKGTTPNEATAATGATGATGEQAKSAAVTAQLLQPGHVTVNVTCPSPTGGAGLMVLPWKVHAKKGGRVTWHLPKATRMDSVVATKVTGKPWPFQQNSYVLKTSKDTSAALIPNAQSNVPYRYKLMAVCGVDTMVIDPDVIVDPTSSKDTTK